MSSRSRTQKRHWPQLKGVISTSSYLIWAEDQTCALDMNYSSCCVESGNQVPFLIFAGSDSPEFRREAAERGAQLSTNDMLELIDHVILHDGATDEEAHDQNGCIGRKPTARFVSRTVWGAQC